MVLLIKSIKSCENKVLSSFMQKMLNTAINKRIIKFLITINFRFETTFTKQG